jgi:hypothetical protein
MTKPIQELKDKHKGQTCWIVGKGPSLQYLTGEYIGPGPVIAINQAVMKVQELKLSNLIYSQQKDGCHPVVNDGKGGYLKPDIIPHDKCLLDMVVPKNGIPLIVGEAESKYCMEKYSPRYIFDTEKDFGVTWDTFSVIVAIKFGQLMGCDKFNFVSCDNCVNGNATTYVPGGKAVAHNNYFAQSDRLKTYLEINNIKHKFITPLLKVKGDKVRLIIATPFYSMSGFSPYIASLLASAKTLWSSGIDFEFWDLPGDSYVDRARNTICNRFLESNATDLVFVDSDMAWQADAFNAILKSPYEVTGCAYPVKNNWNQFGVVINVNENKTPKVDAASGLISADWVPAGFLRIKRSCIEKMAEAFKDQFYYDFSADPDNPGRRYINFFNCSVEGGHRYGEDVNFCRKWKYIGGDLWIEPRITFGHYGMQGWTGNYHEFLIKQPQPEMPHGN